MFQLAIIADDLTGAMDTGLQFAKRDLRTVVSLSDRLAEEATANADVVVLNTNSRADPPDAARGKVAVCGRRVRELGVPRVYKKIDSTLRGNVGPELEGLMDAWGTPTVVMTPAFPAVGRQVVGGLLLIKSVPWADTQYAEGSGLSTSYVAEVIGTKRRTATLELAEIGEGEVSVARQLRQLAESGVAIIVADAGKSVDLAVVARALARSGLDRVVCGSGGLAEELPEALGIVGRGPHTSDIIVTSGRPVLVVAGTVNPVTIQQVRQAQESLGVRVLEVLPETLSSNPVDQRTRVESACQTALQEQRDLVIATVPLSAIVGATMMPRDYAVAEALGPVVATALHPGEWAGVVMTGGDTAIGVCAALGVTALEIVGEVEPGVPCGRLLQGPLAGLMVVTKAGGFGSPEAIAKAISFIRGRTK